MLRVRLLAVTMILFAGAALAGCTSSGSSMFSSSSSPPPQQVLPFQSVPAGATVQTAQGQTCSTPCSLALPVTPQAVSFSLSGYVTQTVQMTVHQGQGSLFSTPPPDLVPNPVVAQLQALPPAPPPPKKVAKPRPRTAAVKPRSAAPRPASMSGPTQPSIAAPEPSGPQDNVFPPPPPTSSPFPPPPPMR